MRIVRILLLILLAVLLLPYLVTPLYRTGHPVSTLMAWRWLKGAPVSRQWIDFKAISPYLPRQRGGFRRRAVLQPQRHRLELAAECHRGRPGGRRLPGGGSTITQQVVKNLFLWPGRSVIRKAMEIPLAMWIDLVLSKARILEIYLNIAEMGPSGQFGAESGAKFRLRPFGDQPVGARCGAAGGGAAQSGDPQCPDAGAGRAAAGVHLHGAGAGGGTAEVLVSARARVALSFRGAGGVSRLRPPPLQLERRGTPKCSSPSPGSGFARSQLLAPGNDSAGVARISPAPPSRSGPRSFIDTALSTILSAPPAPGRPFADADRTILTSLQGPSHGRSQKKNIAVAAWHASLG